MSAQAPTLLEDLGGRVADLKTRQAQAAAKVAQLEADLLTANQRLALGTAAASEVRSLREALEDARSERDGLDSLFSEAERELSEALEADRQRRAEEERERRAKEVVRLERLGAQLAEDIFTRYESLVATMGAFDDVRDELGSKYADLSGNAIAERLRESLSRHPAHYGLPWKRLSDNGWCDRPPAAGGVLRLLAVSMTRPKT